MEGFGNQKSKSDRINEVQLYIVRGTRHVIIYWEMNFYDVKT